MAASLSLRSKSWVLFDRSTQDRVSGAPPGAANRNWKPFGQSLGGPTMQSARNASPSASFHDQVDGPRSVRSLLLDTFRAVSPTNEALEFHNRIEVWVNEGGAGGEAN